MKSSKIPFMLSVVAAALSMASCGHNGHAYELEADKHELHAGEIIFTPAQAKAAGLRTETVRPGEFVNVIEVGGQILPSAGGERTVVATAGGVVAFAGESLAEGCPVKAGQTLALISSSQLQDGDAVKKAKAEYEAAESDCRRAESLAEGQVVSRKQLEQARLRYETARAAYMGLAAHIGAGGVRVSAGISGYVKSVMVQPGDYVSVGAPLFTITQSRRLRLRADVPEQYLRHAQNVVSANFATSTSDTVFSLSQLNGVVLSCAQSLDAGTACLPVTFEFDNRGEFISGSCAVVWLLGQRRESVISVPVAAIAESQGFYYVYLKVNGEKDAYVRREVALGDSDGKRVEIKRGLKAGEQVVVAGAHQVRLAAQSGAIPEGHSHAH